MHCFLTETTDVQSRTKSVCLQKHHWPATERNQNDFSMKTTSRQHFFFSWWAK